MSKRKTPTIEGLNMAKAMRTANYQRKVEAMREGRVERAHVFSDRRKAQSRNACRKANRRNWDA